MNDSTFKDLNQLEKLQLGLFDGPVLAPLVGLKELHAPAWQQGFAWAQELGGLTSLERLTTGSVPLAAQLEGLQLKALDCGLSPELDVEAIIKALPRLEELGLPTWSGAAPPAITKLLAGSALRQLRFAAVGIFEFSRPWTPEGVLELRIFNRMELARQAAPLAIIPEGCVSKVLLRPYQRDPWVFAGQAPVEELPALQAIAKVPVELAWY